LSLGIQEDAHKELRADFQHLHRWRKSVEQAQSLTFKAVIGTLATDFVALVWMGAKSFFEAQGHSTKAIEILSISGNDRGCRVSADRAAAGDRRIRSLEAAV
jgi:hypothetical protein